MDTKTQCSIIPQPVRVAQKPGRFVLTKDTVILAGERLRPVAQYAQRMLAPATGFDLPIVDASPRGVTAIRLDLNEAQTALGAEGYTLKVTPEAAAISATTRAGVFYGLQTLRQLLPVEIERDAVAGVEWAAPCVEIEDYPRFSWRGYMLDEGRHFMGKDVVKRMLDLMALHKLNVFHWHLTEDQGWRIEIKKYPRLTEVGAWRKSTQRGGLLSAKSDGAPHGGYYTQQEIREIIAYAAERFITIVPEIEMPGHSLAALAAYPELGCTGGPFEVATRFGIHWDIYCVGKERVLTFLQDVLDEVMALFPSPFIHIGGDEAPKRRWKSCPDCQARMQAEGLKTEHDLQLYLTNRIAAYLAAHGRRLIGWNEILNDRLTDDALCQYWVRGLNKVLAHARRGRDIVMSDFRYAYLDHSYLFTPLSRAYAHDPVPDKLPEPFHAHILGLEALMWAEFVPNVRRLDWQTFPRLTAFAETGWTPRDKKDFGSFQERLTGFLKRLDLLGVGYALAQDVEPGFWRRRFSFLTILQEQTGVRQDGETS